MENSFCLIKNKNRLWTLFKTCFLISACTFGGGMVIISLLQKKFVEELGWIDQNEVMDLTAIAQSCPGVMSVNTSIMIGYRICGPLGAVITAVGTVLPPMIILSVISLFYTQFRSNPAVSVILKGMPAVVAMIIAAAVQLVGTAWWDGLSHLALENTNWTAVVLSLVLLILLQKKKLGPIQAILASGAVGGAVYWFLPQLLP